MSLNLWGGRLPNPLKKFLEQYKNDIDIFCFQEVYHNAQGKLIEEWWNDGEIDAQLFENIEKVLINHKGFFYSHFIDFWGLAVFIKKQIDILKEGDFFVHEAPSMEVAKKGGTSKNVEYVSFKYKGKKINIINFHGLWTGMGKTDSDSRIKQSKNIVEFLKTLSGEIIFCGDFNLKPDTESLKILEEFGFRNLIKENKITSTRTSLYTKNERFADYVLVTDGIRVNEFKVLPDEVSDHNPIYLDFDLV